MTTTTASATTTSRQQPGLACQECHKRKLRCDRRQPRCGACVDSGATYCFTQARNPRGPKKGHLKALRTRIATLESLIPQDRIREAFESCEQNPRRAPSDHDSGLGPNPSQRSEPDATNHVDRSPHCSPPRSPTSSSPRASTDIVDREMLDLIESDLDQLYFDRVHPTAPIVHQGRYLYWSRREGKSPSHACLQFTMWALAASASAYLQHMRESLYVSARTRLEELDNQMMDFTSPPTLQHAQAWLLLTHYEFRYTTYRRAWITAGRAFRIIQLSRLHEVDPLSMATPKLTLPDEWVEMEEKRRTFWLAYCLDRFVNLTNDGLLSLQEEAIWTHFPAPELDFQYSRPITTGYLAEVMESSAEKMWEPFAETIILTTLCWRALSLKRLLRMESLGQLHRTAQQRLAMLSLPATSMELLDPMRLFANMLANAAVIWIGSMMESSHMDRSEEQLLLGPLYSSFEIVSLAKPLTSSVFYKAPAFSPMLLYLSARFLRTHADYLHTHPWLLLGDTGKKLAGPIQALQVLRNCNNLAVHYLELLASGDDGHIRSVSPPPSFTLTGDALPPDPCLAEPFPALDLME